MAESNFKIIMIILVVVVISILLFTPYNTECAHKKPVTTETFIDDSIKPEHTMFKGTIMRDYENPGISHPTSDMLMTELALQISPDHEAPMNISNVVMSTAEDNEIGMNQSESDDGSSAMIEDITDIPVMSDEQINEMIKQRPLMKMYIEDPIGDNFKNTPIGTMNENPNNKDNSGTSEVELSTLINRYRNSMLDSIQGMDDRNRYVFKNFPMYGRVYY